MASDYQMRVSDAEREAAATELREHYAAGRLTLDELNERLDKAFAAKTRADLNALMTDLPSGRWSAGSGPAGAGQTGSAGPFGVGGPFGPGGTGAGGGAGPGWRGDPLGRGAAHAFGAFLSGFILVSALLLFGILGAFGIGAGRPFGIVLILMAFALLRRLLFRRRVRASRGCGRRW